MSAYGIACRTRSGRKVPIHKLICKGTVNLQYLEPCGNGRFPDAFTFIIKEKGNGQSTLFDISSSSRLDAGFHLGRFIDTAAYDIEIVPIVHDEEKTAVSFTLTYSLIGGGSGDNDDGLPDLPVVIPRTPKSALLQPAV